MGKFLSFVAVGGAVAMATAMMRRRRGIKWNKVLQRSMNFMSNINMKRIMKRGRRMIQSWT